MLINLRNALMAGKKLPYDNEVEYLESTGTQYIDTGLLCSGADEVAITVYIAAGDNRGSWIYFGAGGGARVWATSGVCRFGGENAVAITNARTLESWNTIVLNQTQAVVNGTILSTSLGTFQGTSNLTSFVFRGNGMPSSVAPSLKVASFSWKRNGILVRDLIPVRKGTVGYLYDRVSGKLFGNAGTGDFVLGPDVVPVEYIESHGTEWIDTGVIGKPDTVADISFRWVGNQSADAVILGCRNNSISAPRFIMLMTNQTKIRQLGVGSDWKVNGYYDMDVDYRSVSSFTSSRTTQELDGITIISATSAIADTGLNLALFGNNVNGSVIHIPSARVSQAKIYPNGVLARSFRPVRVGTDATSWEGAMIDTLTRRIYRNQGTGAFTYGNDLKYPIPAA